MRVSRKNKEVNELIFRFKLLVSLLGVEFLLSAAMPQYDALTCLVFVWIFICVIFFEAFMIATSFVENIVFYS